MSLHTEPVSNVFLPDGLATASKRDTVSVPATPLLPMWKNHELVLFRIVFLFLILLCMPTSARWYDHVLTTNWFRPHAMDLYNIGRFDSGISFLGDTLFGNPLGGYAVWVITLITAKIGGLMWSFLVHNEPTEAKEYNLLYYWLRVIVRYRAAIGIITFGFVKLLPVQMPYPSLGQLNTRLGDFTAQKIYWLSVGSVPWYQVFTGAVEVAAGLLLLFRRTTFPGAVLLLVALGTIFFINIGYDGHVHVYSSYFALLALFLLAKDVPYIYRLFIQERLTIPVYIYPALQEHWQKITRVVLKTGVIVVFVGLLGYLEVINFLYDPFKQPSVAGVKALRGHYRVTEFRINNIIVPYSPLDTLRWQEASFEKWTTLTFRVNTSIPLDLSNSNYMQRDINRTFELTGTGGGLRVFHYAADTVNQVLYLQDKNVYTPHQHWDSLPDAEAHWIPAEALAHIGPEVNKIHPRAASARRDREFANAPLIEHRNQMILHYTHNSDGSQVVLNGINENRDSIYVVLERSKRTYLLKESSLQAGKY